MHLIPIRVRFIAISLALLVNLGTTGCTMPRLGRAATPEPHAFISYAPPPPGHRGLRLAVKDNIDLRGEVTTAGSQFLSEAAAPAVRDAPCLSRARAADVFIVGKTNLSEFAIGVSGVNDHFGTPQNPITEERNRIPGGSSSGSAAAVALGLTDVALGTDTAGSIRVPAACCGVSGLKTTFGLIPLEGIYPISPEHLDTVGPLARDVSGLVDGMALLQGGFRDRYQQAVAKRPGPAGIRIGRLYVPGTDRVIDEAIDQALWSSGFTMYRMSEDFLDAWQQAQRDGTVVASAGAWLTNKDIRDERGVSGRAGSAILLGRLAHTTLYEEALTRKQAWQTLLRTVFRDLDAIALPVLKHRPFQIPWLEEPRVFEARVLSMQNTVAVNFAGNPALALPVPLQISEPVVPVTSVQLIGPPESEADLLNIGRILEAHLASAASR